MSREHIGFALLKARETDLEMTRLALSIKLVWNGDSRSSYGDDYSFQSFKVETNKEE